MGVVKDVGFDRMPDQGSYLWKIVEVTFNYELDRSIPGIIVRDDAEGVTIIKLADGRFVLASECQYRLV